MYTGWDGYNKYTKKKLKLMAHIWKTSEINADTYTQ